MNQTTAPETPAAFWSYRDILLFTGFAIPSIFLAVGVVNLAQPLLHLNQGFQDLLSQSLWYIFLFGFLAGLLRLFYARPFWRSLGWTPPFRYAMLCFALGPVLTILVGYIGYAIHAPDIPTPFDEMLVNRPTIILFAIFAVVLGPICEELAFRGFLMPLLIRSIGATAGILSSALLFAALHAPEYHRSWKHVLLIAIAGTAFGYARYRTGSTASSALMHSSYNLTQLAAFLLRSGSLDGAN